MSQNQQRYTCVSKPGEYELVGTSSGAGTMKGIPVIVYRDATSGRLFHREPENFMARMKKIPAEPAINHEMLTAMQQARQWIAENSGAETAPAQLHLMDAMIASQRGGCMSEQQQKLWTVEYVSKSGHYVIRDADGEYVTHLSASKFFCNEEQYHEQLARSERNARRIVACVNALQGASTSELEEAAALGIKDVRIGNLFSSRMALQRQLADMTAQRDLLLAALEALKLSATKVGNVAYNLGQSDEQWDSSIRPATQMNDQALITAGQAISAIKFDTELHGKTIAELQGDGHLGGDA